MGPLAWAFLLLLIAGSVVIVEMFVPSGGLLALLAIGLLTGSIVMAFMHEPWVGLLWVVGTATGVPLMLSFAVRWWPRTSIGRKMMAVPRSAEEMLPEGLDAEDLVGRVGTVKTPMMPSGMVLIDGQLHDAVSEGIPIEPGQTVRIIALRGNRPIVRPHVGTPPKPADSGDPLNQPLESLGIEPLENPLA